MKKNNDFVRFVALTKEQIVDKAIECIKEGVKFQDDTALDELLQSIPRETLLNFCCIDTFGNPN